MDKKDPSTQPTALCPPRRLNPPGKPLTPPTPPLAPTPPPEPLPRILVARNEEEEVEEVHRKLQAVRKQRAADNQQELEAWLRSGKKMVVRDGTLVEVPR